MEIEYKRLVDLKDVDAVIAMTTKHYAETDNKAEEHEFNLDMDQLKMLHEAGMFFAVTALLEGKPVGYIAAAIAKNTFNDYAGGEVFAVYARPDLREYGIGKHLIGMLEDEIKTSGGGYIKLGMRAGHNDQYPLSLGYTVAEISYEKVIEGEE